MNYESRLVLFPTIRYLTADNFETIIGDLLSTLTSTSLNRNSRINYVERKVERYIGKVPTGETFI